MGFPDWYVKCIIPPSRGEARSPDQATQGIAEIDIRVCQVFGSKCGLRAASLLYQGAAQTTVERAGGKRRGQKHPVAHDEDVGAAAFHDFAALV